MTWIISGSFFFTPCTPLLKRRCYSMGIQTAQFGLKADFTKKVVPVNTCPMIAIR
jgi:hypothetical protein